MNVNNKSLHHLLRVYRMFKDNPLKTFVQKDFGAGGVFKPHILCLVSLGLVEKVDVTYEVKTRNGKLCRIKKSWVGYRLIPLKRIKLEEYINGTTKS